MRIIEPASKERTRELLREYFSITCSNNKLYNGLHSLLKRKEMIEGAAVSYAKKHLSFDFSIVFYDVTTLYFETFKEDADVDENGQKSIGLRKQGRNNKDRSKRQNRKNKKKYKKNIKKENC